MTWYIPELFKLADTFGLIVEGPYDTAVYPALIQNIVGTEVKIYPPIECQGVGTLLKKFPVHLARLQHAHLGGPVGKALVIRDWTSSDLRECERRLEERVQRRLYTFPGGIAFCCVRQETESWLLADEEAINFVARERGGKAVPRVPNQIEEIANPKERFVRVLSKAKLPYTPAVCEAIAVRASLEVLRDRCPSFRSFEAKVLGAPSESTS